MHTQLCVLDYNVWIGQQMCRILIINLLFSKTSNISLGLLEVEGTLVGSSWPEKDCSQFDNDRVALLLQPEPRNPLDMIQNGSCSAWCQSVNISESL